MLFSRRKQQGMTIVEVLIALVLLLIIAILITPSYTTYFSQNRLKAVAEGLYDDVLLARTAAIKQSTTTTLTFITGSSWCYGLSSGAIACTCSNAASASNCNLGITSNTDYPNTSLSITGFSSNATTFSAARAVPSVTGTATITATSGENITVTINALGTATITSTTVGGY